MKAVLVLLVLVGVGLAIVYFAGDYGKFDPSEQGRKAKAAIKPGMTWKQVIATNVAGEPKEYRPIVRETKGSGAQKLEILKPGGHSPFKSATVSRLIANKELPDGFVIDYTYSNSVAFRVIFDDAGAVVDVADLTTAADLLQLPTRN